MTASLPRHHFKNAFLDKWFGIWIGEKNFVLKFGPSLQLLLVNFGYLGRAKSWLANFL